MTFKNFVQLIAIGLQARIPMHITGFPGVGKTEFTKSLEAGFARAGVKCKVIILVGSIREPQDFGGFPVSTPDGVRLLPMAWARDARRLAEEGYMVVVFLDELTTVPPTLDHCLLVPAAGRRGWCRGGIALRATFQGPERQASLANVPVSQRVALVKADAALDLPSRQQEPHVRCIAFTACLGQAVRALLRPRPALVVHRRPVEGGVRQHDRRSGVGRREVCRCTHFVLTLYSVCSQ